MSKNRIDKLKEWIVFWLIRLLPKHNVGRFKIGDKVKYNWMAKWYIKSAIVDKIDTVFTIESFYAKGENANYTDGNSCSVFWITKAKV